MKILCFDLDGTIVDLYGVENWLERVRGEDVTPYQDATPLVNMKKLNEICMLLKKAGWEIQVITAMSKNATPEYKKAIREAKKAWLDKYGFIYDHFHGIDYKTRKKEVIRKQMQEGDEAILIDDESRHLKGWGWGLAVNASEENILDFLQELIDDEYEEEW